MAQSMLQRMKSVCDASSLVALIARVEDAVLERKGKPSWSTPEQQTAREAEITRFAARGDLSSLTPRAGSEEESIFLEAEALLDVLVEGTWLRDDESTTENENSIGGCLSAACFSNKELHGLAAVEKYTNTFLDNFGNKFFEDKSKGKEKSWGDMTEEEKAEKQAEKHEQAQKLQAAVKAAIETMKAKKTAVGGGNLLRGNAGGASGGMHSHIMTEKDANSAALFASGVGGNFESSRHSFRMGSSQGGSRADVALLLVSEMEKLEAKLTEKENELREANVKWAAAAERSKDETIWDWERVRLEKDIKDLKERIKRHEDKLLEGHAPPAQFRSYSFSQGMQSAHRQQASSDIPILSDDALRQLKATGDWENTLKDVRVMSEEGSDEWVTAVDLVDFFSFLVDPSTVKDPPSRKLVYMRESVRLMLEQFRWDAREGKVSSNPMHWTRFFFGAPGTGKSTTAWIWACRSSMPVAFVRVSQGALQGVAIVQEGQVLYAREKLTGETVEFMGGFLRDAGFKGLIIFDGISDDPLVSPFGVARPWVVVASNSFRITGDGMQTYHVAGKHYVSSWTLEEYEGAMKYPKFCEQVKEYVLPDKESSGVGSNNDSSVVIASSSSSGGGGGGGDAGGSTMSSATASRNNNIGGGDEVLCLSDKYSYAGGSARFMFTKSEKNVMEAIKEGLDKVSSAYTNILKEQTGKTSKDSIGATQQMFADKIGKQPKYTLVSKYAMRLLIEIVDLAFINSMMQVANQIGNRAILGWAHEMLVHKALMECAVLTMDLQRQGEMEQTEKKQVRIFINNNNVIEFDSLANLRGTISLNAKGVILIPQKCNHPCWDFAIFDQIDNLPTLITIQATVATTHSFKPEAIAELNNIFSSPPSSDMRAIHVGAVQDSANFQGFPDAGKFVTLKRDSRSGGAAGGVVWPLECWAWEVPSPTLLLPAEGRGALGKRKPGGKPTATSSSSRKQRRQERKCLCGKKKNKDVITCGNCLGWFHLGCVQLTEMPAGDWLCAECEGMSGE